MRRLLADSGYAGKVLALESLEHGAATGGNVAYLVGITHLGDSGHGVAASDEGVGSLGGSLSEILGDLENLKYPSNWVILGFAEKRTWLPQSVAVRDSGVDMDWD